MVNRILYHFPVSHFCEKSRWQLDYKQLPYRARVMLPGLHRLRTQWMARINTLPVLRDGERTVGDSTKIAYYLEKYYPQRPLVPTPAEPRAQMIELEQQFDRLGVHVRRWMLSQVLDLEPTVAAILQPYRMSAAVKRAAVPLVREGVRRVYGVTPKAVMRSQQRVEEGLSLLESRLNGGPGDYLVGERFSLADIAAASLLAPLVRPAGSPWDLFEDKMLPAALRKQLLEIRERPAGQWVLARYAQDR